MEIVFIRGNFRRSTCYYPPIKVDFKKKQTKGTVFEGHKNEIGFTVLKAKR